MADQQTSVKPPSTPRQKAYIIENTAILDRSTKIAILTLVMMEIGKTATFENGVTKEVSINLDAITDPDIVLHIYNIVRHKRDALNEPLKL